VSFVAVLALVFAVSGGAYAAGSYLITSTKQISPSVLAQLKGNASANDAKGASGAQGPAGAAETGSVVGGTLPKGATETGTYAVSTVNREKEELATSAISFPITLKRVPVETSVIPLGGSLPEGCKGTPAEPGAAPGHLCVFEGKADFLRPDGLHTLHLAIVEGAAGGLGAETTGAELVFQAETPKKIGETVFGEGTWAVTAE
jgi:hypothetical protein